MTPRPELTPDESQAFIKAFERAVREIPTVRGFRVGRRITHGAAYESLAAEPADYVAIIDFDDLAGLQAYLVHPLHVELGARFYSCLSAAMVYDFEVGGLELLAEKDAGAGRAG